MAFIMTKYNNKRLKIEKKLISINEREWFIREYRRSFQFIFNNKILCITNNDKEVHISPENDSEKEKYLHEAAKIEFNDYIASPKDGYKAIAAWLEKTPIGVLLYREMNHNGPIYFAQGFVLPEHQHNEIGDKLLFDLIKSLRKEFDVITRHAALNMCKRLSLSLTNHSRSTRLIKNDVSFFETVEEPINFKFVTFEVAKTSCEKEWLLKELKRSYYEKMNRMKKEEATNHLNEIKEWIDNSMKFIDGHFIEYKSILILYRNRKIGCLLYKILNPKHIINIEHMCIVNEYQRRGIGTHCLNTIFNQDLSRIQVSVRPKDQISINFFQKAGFVSSKTCDTVGQLMFVKYLKNVNRENSLVMEHFFTHKPKQIFIWSSLTFVIAGCLNFRGKTIKRVFNLYI